MTDKTYPYDPDLPYVVVNDSASGIVCAGFSEEDDALEYKGSSRHLRVIDTTPAPRVPEDAKCISYFQAGAGRKFAYRSGGGWAGHDGDVRSRIEDLPGVTHETTFTVLDAREERES